MNFLRIFSITFYVAVMFSLSGCGGSGDSGHSNIPGNTTSLAHAGEDQEVQVNTLVVLDGTGSADADGDNIFYEWSIAESPVGSSTTLSNSTSSSPEFSADIAGQYTINLIINDGNISSNEDEVIIMATPLPLSSINSGYPSALYNHIDDYDSRIILRNLTSPLDGKETTQIVISSYEGSFNINCEEGNFVSYYISTDNITGSGLLSYRIGASPEVTTEHWMETSSYKVLVPNSYSLELLQKLYQNWDAVFDYDTYISGSGVMNLNLSGLPILFDKTREQCGWSRDLFPEDNGWGKEIPNLPPSNYLEAAFTTDYKPFRTIAWRDKDSSDNVKLLVRVGDYESEGTCNGSFTITNNFYIRQDDKYVSAVVGSKAKVSCEQPETLILQGDFDASRKFTLEVFPFHYNAVTRVPGSTLAPDGPIATVEFLDFSE